MEPNVPDRIAAAASVLLIRERHGELEVYTVARSRTLRFFGGFQAFPGGKVSPDDDRVPVKGCTAAEAKRIAAAARELFEETGVLIARSAAGQMPRVTDQWIADRRLLIDDKLSFASFLAANELSLWSADFHLLGRLVTPEFNPIRFDTAFFAVHWSMMNDEPDVWSGELERGQWWNPSKLLKRWNAGDCLISPPSLSILEAISDAPFADVGSRLSTHFHAEIDAELPAIYFSPGVRFIPLRTQALPPSTHTNAYLIGTGPVYLLDPGPQEQAEQGRLFRAIDEYTRRHDKLTAILLSHDHDDHIGAANACSSRYGVPIWAHAQTARALSKTVPTHRMIEPNDRLPLGQAPAGGAWHLEAIYTPGHASGHLAFFEPRYQLLFAGDMVSTQSSVVIAPPEGDLSQYLESLRGLLSLEARVLFPSHGIPSSRPAQTIDDALMHRAKREEMLLATLQLSPMRIAELTIELYKGVPGPLLPLAELQVQAGLQKLEQEGRVAPGPGDRWQVTNS